MSVQTKIGIEKVPVHLRQFVVEQQYDNYTPVDQAVWRYVMRQNRNFLGQKAHKAYLGGLRESGIGIESIPNIQFMDEQLSRIGWGAVTVDGFIPPGAFMDFQANRILAIAADIRTLDHVAYTPAPDIIHEAAGHAPIILDATYRQYLQVIGDIGAKAFSSKEDHDVYEAIRQLSIVKEDVNSTEEEVRRAEEGLERAVKAVAKTSEASLVSRLYWWTVEYGLIGDVDNPVIYGAGLLSSVGESISCLQPDVRKIPFSLDACIATDYDITKPQPQLFVCKDFHELMDAAKALGTRLAYAIGGTYSLQKALESSNTATVVYSSGLQVSGTISEIEYDDNQEAVYFKTSGPSALAYHDCELLGHGKEYHYEGFGSPIGMLKDVQTPQEDMTDEQLQETGVVQGEQAVLQFASGVRVEGVVKSVLRIAGKVALISFDDCTVTYGTKTLFQSEWGPYDMAVGASIVSAYPGAADKKRFETGPHQPSSLKTKRPALTQEEQRRNMMYQTIRDLREGLVGLTEEETEAVVECTMKRLNEYFPDDWLLRLEILELLSEQRISPPKQAEIRADLHRLADEHAELKPLIGNGLALIAD